MIVLGDFETELDFSMEPTLRDSFVKLRLIGPKTDMVSLKQYISQLTVRVMHEIMRARSHHYRMADAESCYSKE